MKSEKSPIFGGDIAVRARGNGFYYTIRRFVSEKIQARRRRLSADHAAWELAQLPDYLKQDIQWPPAPDHEEH